MRVAVAGGYGVGMTVTVASSPGAGETVLGSEFSSGPGGKGSNQAIAARRLGAAAALLTCVGPDEHGAAGRELWRTEGVNARAVKTGTRYTMVGVILVEPTGENRIVVAPGALDELAPEDVSAFEPDIRDADVCLVSLEIPADTAVAVLRAGRESNVTTILNPAPPVELAPDQWLLADIITPNRQEAAMMCGADPHVEPDELMDELRAFFAGAVVLTLGAAGALIEDHEGRRHVPAIAARRVVDTTGAGDAFNGALAAALADGQSLDAAVRTAVAAGAHAVGIPEVVPALPRRADLGACLDSTTVLDPTSPPIGSGS